MRQSDYHFTDRDKLYDAPNQGFGRDIELLSLSKAMKNSKGVQELWFFDIDCKNLDAWILFASRAEKTPGHLFVMTFYGRVNTIKVKSIQSVNLLGSQRRLNAYSSTFDFRIEVYTIKIFYNALKFVSCHFIVLQCTEIRLVSLYCHYAVKCRFLCKKDKNT